MHMNEFDQKTMYFGVPMRLVTCLTTNKIGGVPPNRPRPGRFSLFEDVHERLKAMNGGYVFCVKNRLGDVVLLKTVKIQDSPLLMEAKPKFSRKGAIYVYWKDIFPEAYSGKTPSRIRFVRNEKENEEVGV